MSITYSFLPWLRQGAATAIAEFDDPNQPTLPSIQATLPIQLQVETRELNAQDQVGVNLRLYGPGDVIGIDRQQIIRTEPPHRTNNFLPNYFPAIEFDHPGFPWLFTPAQAEKTQGRLRPWLVLVVVRKQTGVTLRGQGDGPLPVLEIRSPAIARDELPDLAESWAWAHAQVVHSPDQLDTALTTQPEQTVSRLLCPRQLAPHATYYACLVPAFEVGRNVGLGQPLTDHDQSALHPAWHSDANAPVEIQLPVYYHWEFSTGQEGDFEFLAQQLQPRELPAGAGFRRLQVGHAGVSHFPDFGTVDFAGVFRPLEFDSPEVPADAQLPQTPQGNWQRQLKQTLNAGAAADGSDPVVGPPIYGQFQHPSRLEASAGWLRDVNLDPRHRAAAGLGVLFVQAHQDDLMHAAWQQLGDIQQAKQLIRQNELAQSVGEATYAKHFQPLVQQAGALLYQMTAPAHARVVVTTTRDQTLVAWAKQQQQLQPVTLNAFRKVARPGGAISRRLHGNTVNVPLPLQAAQAGIVEPKSLETTRRPLASVMNELALRAKQWQGANPAIAARMAQAVEGLNAHFSAQRSAVSRSANVQAQPPQPLSLLFNVALQQQVLHALNPKTTVPRLLHSRLQQFGKPVTESPAPLAHPVFPQPMYEGIREFMPDLLLPGADRIDDNSVTLLETNPQFIEAFMVGLNHEMARELLWREFPTDQRGTYFQSFWSRRSADLQQLHTWKSAERLGSHLTDGRAAGQLVIVIRGELLRRFPDAIIYAVNAENETTLGTIESYPLHRGQLTDDAVFLLFDLSDRQVLGQDGTAGWFFVIQQQPTALRFGLDVETWSQISTTSGGYLSVTATSQQTEPPVAQLFNATDATWGFNSAHMAEMVLQRPFRVAIHGRRWLTQSVL